MTAVTLAMSLPRFSWRFQSLLNSALRFKTRGRGGGGGGDGPEALGLRLATSAFQVPEHLFHGVVPGHVLAGIGLADGLDRPGVGDVRLRGTNALGRGSALGGISALDRTRARCPPLGGINPTVVGVRRLA